MPLTADEKIRNLKVQITLYQQVLDLVRRLFRLTTMRERAKWRIEAEKIAKGYQIDAEAFLATIECESGFNPNAINHNKDGTKDLGICQFNDYWYKSVISPHDALHDPEKALHTMAKMWQEGRAEDWVCYKTKRYLRYLRVGP